MGLRLVDMSRDQVARAEEIMERNPGLLITTPKQNGTPHFIADFVTKEDAVVRIHHEQLRVLLDELTGRYGFEDA